MNHKLNTPQANVFTFNTKDVTFLHKMTRLIALQKPQTEKRHGIEYQLDFDISGRKWCNTALSGF